MSLPISPERIVYDLPSVAQPVISPDGEHIAYVNVTIDRKKNKPGSHIWLCEIDGTNHRQLTQSGEANSGPVWAPDGSSIAYVSMRDGDHPNAIAILPLSGGESRIVTRHAKSPSGLAWSPDGTQIAYTVAVDPANPNETPRDPEAAPEVRVTRRFDYKQDGYGYLGEVRDQLFIVNAGSGERRQVTSEVTSQLKPVWSPDGTKIATAMPHSNGMLSRIAVIDVASGELNQFGAESGIAGIPSWSPDGKYIFYAGDEHGKPHADYFLLDVAAASVKKIVDSAGFSGEVYYYTESAPVWLNDNTVLVGGMLKGRSGLWTIDPTNGEISQLALWNDTAAGISVSADRSRVVQQVSSLDGYLGFAVVDTSNGERTLIYNAAEAFFKESPAAQWEEVSVERAGDTIHGWLLKPNDFDESKQYPLIIDIHGGPHGAYSASFNIFCEMPATNGFLVLFANPRGSTSYGREFAEGCIQDWGGGDWEDLQAILDHVVARPYVDAERTGVYGYSYGGFMTSWILGHTNRFKAALCGAPVFDLRSFYGTSDVGHAFAEDEIGGTPWTAEEQYIKHSPSTYIHNATTPTLIVCGEADDRCPIGQSEQLYIALLKLGVDVEFARYPGGAHPFIVTGPPAHRLDFLERYLAWFKKYLGEPE